MNDAGTIGGGDAKAPPPLIVRAYYYHVPVRCVFWMDKQFRRRLSLVQVQLYPLLNALYGFLE